MKGHGLPAHQPSVTEIDMKCDKRLLEFPGYRDAGMHHKETAYSDAKRQHTLAE